ncbi:MAG TPA: hypothetical protein VL944_01890 [Candidatus Acidoferrum sp.]|nr:hypothetical protein [Candidatus Acidoferrum sp.]
MTAERSGRRDAETLKARQRGIEPELKRPGDQKEVWIERRPAVSQAAPKADIPRTPQLRTEIIVGEQQNISVRRVMRSQKVSDEAVREAWARMWKEHLTIQETVYRCELPINPVTFGKRLRRLELPTYYKIGGARTPREKGAA